jgi:hypothetical protein
MGRRPRQAVKEIERMDARSTGKIDSRRVLLAAAVLAAVALAWADPARSTTAPPGSLSAPSISGTAQQGKTLSASPGSWSGSPTSYAYRWNRCDKQGAGCQAISGATARTYTLLSTDVGHTLRVRVTASNEGGQASALSNPTAVVTAPPPVKLTRPTISGSAQQGSTLTASPGTWSNEPTSYAYQWKRCDTVGANCLLIAGATGATYILAPADIGSTLRIRVIAYNSGGHSAAALSLPTAVVVGAGGAAHLEYVFNDSSFSVYDMDNGWGLVKKVSLPQTQTGVRGVSVAPSKHLLFISYGGDGAGYTGSVLAYDLVTEKVVWTVNLSTGIDSGQVSPDGKRLYMPTGENTSSGIWNILDTSTGAVTGTIQGGSGAHNTVVSADGRYVYLGGRNYNYLDYYDTTTGEVHRIGPLVNSVRPFTVNGSNTLAFTTATNFDGFQVSSIPTGKVLFTTSFGSVPSGFAFSAPSHGISLSPDEKQLYVIDSVNKEVRVYDVSRVSEGVAPSQLGVIPVAGLSGTETPCAYDCTRGGWLQRSIDGRYVFVGDSGEVIETATRKVLTTLPALANTKKSLEVEWANGVPIASSERTGIGGVH